MSTPLKQHKEVEGRLHEQLYSNVLLLTYIYPISKDFDAVFKKDMFAKNNKAAFHQVVYYLLNCLNPELTREKITTWPLYDIKLENKFRNEVLNYVNELNSIYEHADIPSIVTSHLISPGGFKFVKFMWKLSQLVLYEHLKKNEIIKKELLNPLQPHEKTAITNIGIKHKKKKTSIVEANTREEYEKFIIRYQNQCQEASNIIFEQSQVNSDLDELFEIQKSKISEFQNSIQTIKESINQKIDEIKIKNTNVEKLKELCIKSDELLNYLSSNDTILECEGSTPVLLKNAGQFGNSEGDKLDLHCLFARFISVLEQENLKMPIFTVNEINKVSQMIEDLIERLTKLEEKLKMNSNKFIEVQNVFHQVVECKMEPERKESPLIKVLVFPENENTQLENVFDKCSL